MKTVTLKVKKDEKALCETYKVMNVRKCYAKITFYKNLWTLNANGIAYYCSDLENAMQKIRQIADDHLNMLGFNTKVEITF